MDLPHLLFILGRGLLFFSLQALPNDGYLESQNKDISEQPNVAEPPPLFFSFPLHTTHITWSPSLKHAGGESCDEVL